MIGTVIMEIGEAEMIAAIQFYLNQSVFWSESGFTDRKYHRATVTSVKQRKGRFFIEFEGRPEPEWPSEVEDTRKAEVL